MSPAPLRAAAIAGPGGTVLPRRRPQSMDRVWSTGVSPGYPVQTLTWGGLLSVRLPAGGAYSQEDCAVNASHLGR